MRFLFRVSTGRAHFRLPFPTFRGSKRAKSSAMRSRFAVAIALAATLGFTFTGRQVAAQESDRDVLAITPVETQERSSARATPPLKLEADSAFARLRPGRPEGEARTLKRERPALKTQSLGARLHAPVPPALQSFGTGGGDIDEREPNDSVAQGVSLPVNIQGRIGVDLDVDFFAFQALAGQSIVVEPFAARIAGSQLIADIALFTSDGVLLDDDTGDLTHDPLIRFRSSTDQILIVGISDADNFGGSDFIYLLNITRGDDVDEVEPNGTTAQALGSVPATIFGEISNNSDLDFYSFQGQAGQTLIVDVDAEVLGSRLDAEANLSDPATGLQFFFNDQADGDDPRFNIVLPYTGRFVVGIGSFAGESHGFYRLNISVVSGSGAPLITSVTRLSKKLIEVTGTGLTSNSVVEMGSDARKTTLVAPGVLHAKAKARPGKVITVSNLPDGRRSNPLLVQ